MVKNKLPSVNLLKKEGKSFFDKFIQWALTVGRILVMLTEIVALSAFLYRFSLDRKLIDLHDQIKLKDAYVKVLKSNEDKYRNLQERLAIATKLSKTSVDTTNLITDLIAFTPSDIIFNSLKISEDSVSIDANVQSVTSLTDFINKLKEYKAIRTVSLDRIENKTSTATIVVDITAVLKKQPTSL